MLAYVGCVAWWTTNHNHYTSPPEVQTIKYKYFHNHLLTCQNHTTLTQQFLDQEVNSVVWCHGGKYQRSECKPENETSDTCTADYKTKTWKGFKFPEETIYYANNSSQNKFIFHQEVLFRCPGSHTVLTFCHT